MIYEKQCIRIGCEILGYVEVQNEFTGNITRGLRELHQDGCRYFIRADGKRVDMTHERDILLEQEDFDKECRRFWKENNRRDWLNK